MKKVTVAEIMEEFQPKEILVEMIGDGSTVISGIAAIESGSPGDLVFLDKNKYLPEVRARRPSAIVTSPALKDSVKAVPCAVVLVAPNVALAHALIKRRYADRDFAHSGWSGIHASAVVHESAVIGAGTQVEPNVVVGKNARIGSGCRLLAGVVIENDVVIGDNTIIHPNVVVGYACMVGNEVVIGAGSVIGSEGYGFAQDGKRRSYPIPQTGIVVLEDRVRVGAGNCIDRAAFHETRIGAGTKLDNLCHVAHNVSIGTDCLLTAMLCVAGSSKIGNRVITSGQTGILDHMEICDDVVLLHRAGVNKDISRPGAYAGLPLQPLSDYMKNAAASRSLAEMRRRLGRIEKQLGLSAESETPD